MGSLFGLIAGKRRAADFKRRAKSLNAARATK
jgi:hypothetical protein